MATISAEGGPASSLATFELRIGAWKGGDLAVSTFRGRERISRPFSFDLQVHSDTAADVDPDALVGAPATLLMQLSGPSPRIVQGIIASVRLAGRLPVRPDRQAFRLRLVPKLWALKQRTTSRIFQDMTIPDIAKAVLDAAGIANDWKVSSTYAKREYCVQYRESDYAFLARILAEEGIFYWFEHPTWEALAGDASEKVVFADAAPAYADAGLRLMLEQREQERADSAGVVGFEIVRSLRPDGVLVRDYDFTRPAFDERGQASIDGAPTDASDDDAKWNPTRLRGVYDHRREHVAVEIDDARARVRLEQVRRRSSFAGGRSSASRLSPGSKFTLEAFDSPSLSGEYAVTSVEHEGHAPGGSRGNERLYENTFQCVLASVPARPERPKRVHKSVLETAVVVGPEGEEIHTDEGGRIRVQFHWDIDGKSDEHSSCWIRHVTAWAGPKWGSQFIPRIGMEVMVSFLGGDQDAPVVVGCVYNATHPPSFNLPESKTRSGLRTQTTPDGGGWNEVSFEDQKGKEQIFVRAQRDLDERVGRNHTVDVLGDEVVAVHGNRGASVDGDQTETIVGKLSRNMKKDEDIRVEGSRTDVVLGGADVTVKGPMTTRTGGERREITGRSELLMTDDYTVRSKGCYTTIVGLNEAKRSYVLRVEGTGQLSSSGVMLIDAEKGITLKCGKSFIKVSADKIEIVSPSVSAKGEGGGVVADDKVEIRAKEQVLVASKEIILKTPDASIGLKKDVHVDGQKILLNSPDQATDPPKDTSPPPTKIALKDKNGKPLAYQRFLITLADGSEYSGILDSNGETEMPVDGSGKITFPDLASHGPG